MTQPPKRMPFHELCYLNCLRFNYLETFTTDTVPSARVPFAM